MCEFLLNSLVIYKARHSNSSGVQLFCWVMLQCSWFFPPHSLFSQDQNTFVFFFSLGKKYFHWLLDQSHSMKEKKMCCSQAIKKNPLTIVAEEFSMVSCLWKIHGLISAINNLSLDSLYKTLLTFPSFQWDCILRHYYIAPMRLSPSLPLEKLIALR